MLISDLLVEIQKNGRTDISVEKVLGHFSAENEISILCECLRALCPSNARQVTQKLPSISPLVQSLETFNEIAKLLVDVSVYATSTDISLATLELFSKSIICKLLHSAYSFEVLRLLACCDIKYFLTDEYIEIFNHMKYENSPPVAPQQETVDGAEVNAKENGKKTAKIARNKAIEEIFYKVAVSNGNHKHVNFVFPTPVITLIYKNGRLDILQRFFAYNFINYKVVRTLVTRVLHPADFDLVLVLLQNYPDFIQPFYSAHNDEIFFLFIRLASACDSSKSLKFIPQQFTRQFLTKSVLNDESRVEAVTACGILAEMKYEHLPASSTIVSLFKSVGQGNEDLDFALMKCLVKFMEYQSFEFDGFKVLVPLLKSLDSSLIGFALEILKSSSQSNYDYAVDIVDFWTAMDNKEEHFRGCGDILVRILEKSVVFEKSESLTESVVLYLLAASYEKEFLPKMISFLKKYSNPVHIYGLVESHGKGNLFYGAFADETFKDMVGFVKMLSQTSPPAGDIRIPFDELNTLKQCLTNQNWDMNFVKTCPHSKLAYSIVYAAMLGGTEEAVLTDLLKNTPLSHAQLESFLEHCTKETLKSIILAQMGSQTKDADLDLYLDSECASVEIIGFDRVMEHVISKGNEVNQKWFELLINHLNSHSETVDKSVMLKILKFHLTKKLAVFVVSKLLYQNQTAIACPTLLKLVLSHSKSAEMIETNFDGFVQLLHTIVVIDPQVEISEGLFQTLADKYQFTINRKDSLLEDILMVFEMNHGISLMEHLNVSEIANNLDPKWMIAVSNQFDVHEPLERALEFNKPTLESSESKAYSSRFVLAFAAHCVVQGSVSLEQLLETNIILVVIRALSSVDDGYRKVAAGVLSRIMQKFPSPFSQENQASEHPTYLTGSNFVVGNQVTFLSGMKFKNEVYYILKYLESCYDGENPVPSLTTVFFTHALRICRNPSHPLYTYFNRFILSRPIHDERDVPMFYEMFFQTFPDSLEAESKQSPRNGRKFMLNLLAHIYTPADFECVKRRKAIHLLVTYSPEFKNEILTIFKNALKYMKRYSVDESMLSIISSSLVLRKWLSDETKQMIEDLKPDMFRRFPEITRKRTAEITTSTVKRSKVY